jgi:UDP:flavonoid glycosyltransferase YjiC (YdhE family)
VGICAPQFAAALSIAELSKPRIAALPNVHMTGPIVVEPQTDIDFARYRPYCYLSLGTSPWDKAAILERYRQIVRSTPPELNAVIGLGGLAAPEELEIDDARAVIMSHAPQIAAIKESELVICHGGCQTVHEALYFGKPIVGIPHHAEIAEMVNAVEICGAGVRLAPSQLSAAKLREAIGVATASPTRAAAARLAEVLRRADGHANVLKLFERLEQRVAAH